MVCTVPDLIAVLDSQSGSSIGTQDYRYGLRVTVIGLACDPCWTTERGLEVGGPVAFGCVSSCCTCPRPWSERGFTGCPTITHLLVSIDHQRA